MQREMENRDEPIDGSRGFPSRRSMMSSIFGEKDPFDDPFFSRPFGSIFKPSIFDTKTSDDDDDDGLQHPNTSSSKELVIEEMDSDDEGGEDGNNLNSEVKDKKPHEGGTVSGKAPIIEHPDDEAEEVKRDVRVNKNHNRNERTKPQTQSFSFKKVSYGGINGTYYTATTTRKSGSDGVVLEDSKEADRTTGRATHRISKGIHDKGHSVTRNLGADGKVDTVQTLHNLNEDELVGFEQDWKGNTGWHIPGWDQEFGSFGRTGSGSVRPFGLAIQSADRFQSSGRSTDVDGAQTSSSDGRRKKVVTINID